MTWAISSFISTLGFAVIFNVKRKFLLAAGCIGGIGGLVYFILFSLFKSEALALFFASAAITLSSELAARRYKCPSITFLSCAMIPLVPGLNLYQTMMALIDGDFNLAFSRGFTTLTSAIAIALGCILIKNVFFKKPAV